MLATDTSPIVMDCETAPLADLVGFIDPPDLDGIQAPSNYVKPEAIEAYIAREKAKRLEDHARALSSRAALDPNTARLVALGWWVAGEAVTVTCPTEAAERSALERFWAAAANRMIVGFKVREFDLPMLLQRSLYLGVRCHRLELGRYARGSSIVDLYDVLTFNDLRHEQVMRRTLKAFARRLGIPVPDAIAGADIPALVAAGDWAGVQAHCAADVQLTVALAERLGLVSVPVTDVSF